MKMKQWMLTFCVVVISSVYGQDKCGNRCKDGQICTNDRTCVDRSDLKHCGLWYCKSSQDCCGFNKCMPKGSKCCPNGIVYCQADYTCCGIFCCHPGYNCIAGRCTLDNPGLTTKKVKTTAKPTTRRSIRTTKAPINTRRVIRTFRPPTNRYTSFKIKSRFVWWYGLIIGSVVTIVITVVAVSILLWRRRSAQSNAPVRPGSSGQVLGVPGQTHQPYPAHVSYMMAPKTSVQPIRQTGQAGKNTDTRKPASTVYALSSF